MWNGYGRIRGSVKGVEYHFFAHRRIYEMLRGPVPDDLTLDHLCRVRHCVNPAHLEPVSNRENVLRGVGPTAENARRTHCRRGHPFAGKNLILTPASDGTSGVWRGCRECVNARRRERRKEARGVA